MNKLTCIMALAAAIATLAGCDGNKYEVSTEHCNNDYFKSLPEGEKRDALVVGCSTRGEYKSSPPKTW